MKVRVLKSDYKTFKTISVDRDIARLISELNRHGIRTLNCCCGHGNDYQFYITIESKNAVLDGDPFHPIKDRFVRLVKKKHTLAKKTDRVIGAYLCSGNVRIIKKRP